MSNEKRTKNTRGCPTYIIRCGFETSNTVQSSVGKTNEKIYGSCFVFLAK